MKSDILQDAIGEVMDDYIQDAHAVTMTENNLLKRHTLWLKWGAALACLCVIMAGVTLVFHQQMGAPFQQGGIPFWQKNGDGQGNNHVQQWDADFSADQYFAYSNSKDIVSKSSISDSALPYTESRHFSSQREQLEAEGILPPMDAYPQFRLQGNYYTDGSLYSLELEWSSRNQEDISAYSTLTVTAGYDEVPSIQDCIFIEVDENGNVLEPAVTVTERDGIRIIAKEENRRKTLTFQTEKGWYQITGSWNDSYEAVAELLDWFWTHPIDFDLFPMEKGDHYTSSRYTEMPDSEALQGLAAYLPSFEAFGFACQEVYVTSKNGTPISFEGHFISGVTDEQLESMEYTVGEERCTTIHWCLDAEPETYEWEGCIGNLEELRESQIRSLMPVDEVTTEIKISFTQGNCVITVYTSDVGEAWKLIDSLR